MLYPAGHPYHWPTIGYMEDLTAASYDDVVEFFKTYYAPNNASLVDRRRHRSGGDARARREVVRRDHGPGRSPSRSRRPAAYLTEVKRKTITDQVQLPRLYLAWLTPAGLAPGDAALDVVSPVLAGGKNSRLYKRLVYDLQIAQDVMAVQSRRRSGQLPRSWRRPARATRSRRSRR